MVVELEVVEFSVCYIHDAMCELKCCVTTYMLPTHNSHPTVCMYVGIVLHLSAFSTCRTQCVDHVQTM